MSATAFLQQAQEPGMAQLIDQMLDRLRESTGATWKQMLRAQSLLLRSIAVSMPWDEENGLDARRFHLASKTSLPSWRECIGACLHLEFTLPEADTAPEPESESDPDSDPKPETSNDSPTDEASDGGPQ